MKHQTDIPLPTIEQLETELKRIGYRIRFRRMVCNTISILLVVAAAAVLISMLLFPVLKIYGSSMTPTLTNGDIVIAFSGGSMERGDIIAFSYNNQILVKRVIALPGEWVDIDADGTVSIDGEVLEEPYLQESALGTCDIELPYQVPEGHYFVLGDLRSTSSDSRNSAVGCVAEAQVIGKILLRIWPLEGLGGIN